jgi:adenylate cyclase
MIACGDPGSGGAVRRAPDHDPRDPLERLVALGTPRFTGSEVALRAGVDRDVADRLWRALGFPNTEEDERAFTEQDVKALEIATEGLDRLDREAGERAVEMIVREARIFSAHMANLAEVEGDAIPALHALGVRERVIEEAVEQGFPGSDLEWLITFGFRRLLHAAMRRQHNEPLEPVGSVYPTLAVAFLDLVDFTSLSSRAEPEELDAALARFETLVFDTVTELGGRVVKLIGDEAMITCTGAADAVQAAQTVIADCLGANLPAARAGIAYGPLLRRNGDYFGRPVNLASRLVDVAEPGEILIDEATEAFVRGIDDIELELPRHRSLKGLGTVPTWQVGGEQNHADTGREEE